MQAGRSVAGIGVCIPRVGQVVSLLRVVQDGLRLLVAIRIRGFSGQQTVLTCVECDVSFVCYV